MEIPPVQYVPQVADVMDAVSIENRRPDQRELIEAVSSVNAAALLGQDKELTFQMDRETRQVVVRVVNKQTGEVVRQVPAEYVLDVARALRQEA